MTESVETKVYSKRSNAKRAAVAALGSDKFEIVEAGVGFTYRPVTPAETDVPPIGEPDAVPARVKAARDPLIEEAYDMGKKRSDAEREGAITDALNMGEQAQEPEVAREAVRKLTRLRAPIPQALAEKAKQSGRKVSQGPRASAKAKALVNVAKGKLPPAPDFSAETHKRFRPKLAELIKLAKEGDVAALRAYPIKPTSTSPKALDRYRNFCIQAIEARGAEGATESEKGE